MNVLLSWLKDYTVFDEKQFADRMTMTGTKVETLTPLIRDITKVVTGRIIDITQHPNADKLVITKVDIGNQTLQIVTGATNIFVNAIVPVAMHGAILADGTKIKKGKLRGEVSDGMLCSLAELGGDDSSGIFILDEQPLGVEITKALQDSIAEFEITSNRADCFSVYGIARETSVAFNTQLKPVDVAKIEISSPKQFTAHQNCKRYMYQVLTDVKIDESPVWLKQRLQLSGIKSINNVVDITNYVMLELGQPLHAFDYEKIHGDITLRLSNEEVMTLAGKVKLDDTLVVADDENVLAVAGIVGCEHSKVTSETKTILLECANFDAYDIRLSEKKLHLATDSSFRFKKNLDTNLCSTAIARTVLLLQDLCGAKLSGTCIDYYPIAKQLRRVPFNFSKVNELLGTDISETDMLSIFSKLEITFDNGELIIPSFRDDIETNCDIAEEVARFIGYNNIKSTVPLVQNMLLNRNDTHDIIKNIMISQGFCEIKTYSFESPNSFIPNTNSVKLLNPLGEEYSIMRTTLLNAMLNILKSNHAKQNANAALFELSKVFGYKDNLPCEKYMLALGMDSSYDFFTLKGVLETLFDKFNVNVKFQASSAYEFMHPYQTAELLKDNCVIGLIGKLTDFYVAMLEVDSLTAKTHACYKPISRYPAVYRDVSIVVPIDVTVDMIKENILPLEILESVTLEDMYIGKQILDGFKSMTYKLVFRHMKKTLTDEEVAKALDKILLQMKTALGISLRS